MYRQLMRAKESGNIDLEKEAVEKLAEVYKNMFKLDYARAIIIVLANEYLLDEKLAEVTDGQYGQGSAKYIAQTI